LRPGPARQPRGALSLALGVRWRRYTGSAPALPAPGAPQPETPRPPPPQQLAPRRPTDFPPPTPYAGPCRAPQRAQALPRGAVGIQADVDAEPTPLAPLARRGPPAPPGHQM